MAILSHRRFFYLFKVLLNPGPCIHYIWSPTLQRTMKCNCFSKSKRLNTFSHQQLEQSCDFCQCLVKACRRSFHSPLIVL
ncbi:hypothetical protein AB205_0196490 [Aquarana catesbeiana]|uniref:Uncharacterized protein n=1 Tax=Aquarana catesbeiana TaxID=8400 RepID=A0A2G9SFI7_AQUCT|nr:hypothetical protein AB205_0196490 [Aquarana catesbeiana]